MYKCAKCKTEFKSENDLINHNISVHSSKRKATNEEQSNTKKGRLICDKCREEFSSNSLLETHQEQCLKCNLCQKQFSNNKDLQSHRMKHFVNEEIHSDQNDEYEEQSAFSNKLIDRKWILKDYKDPIKTLQSFRSRILNLLFKSLRDHASPLKFSIAMRLKVAKLSSSQNKEYKTMGLFSGTHLLLTYSNGEEKYSEASQQLIENFDKWNSEGSGIFLEKVESITLKIAKTRLIQGSSYIPTPKVLNTRVIVNVRNRDNRCFEYAVLSALHYDELRNQHNIYPKNY